MNPLNQPNYAVPRPNGFYPMANMQTTGESPYSYNQPTEVVGGYDAKINPMTGQEIPTVNMAGGGLASLTSSPYRDMDVMQVKMTPREVAGLQQLAMAYGATPDDLYDPVTGQPQFSFLKKILPMIAGAVLPSVPGVGEFAKTIGFGSQALGTSLLVGGVTGLIEGDLRKGLEAGLGAYTGATLASGLSAAQKAVQDTAAKSAVTTAPPDTFAKQLGLSEDELIRPFSSTKDTLGVDVISPLDTPLPAIITPQQAPPVSPLPSPPKSGLSSLTGGVSALFKPEGREAFMGAMGGGFKSPLAQSLSKYAMFAGVANALTPEAKPIPTGPAEEDIVYIPGQRNPQYGTGRDQPYYLPGQYYKRTTQGLVPYNPYQLAPGYGQTPAMPQGGFTAPRGRGFADGGMVNDEVGMLGPFYGDTGIVQGTPGFAPAFATTAAPAAVNPFQGPINVPAYAAPTTDPNVLATRAYIEELNRRVRTPISVPSSTDAGRGGLSSFGGAGLPIVDETGGAAVGGAEGPGVGDLVGGIAANYLINKGIGAGVDYLRDQFTTDPTIKRARETPVTDSLEGVDLSTLPATQAALAALNPYNIPAPPQFTVGVEEIPDAQQPSVTDSLEGVDLSTLPATQAALAALNPYNVPAPQFTVGVEEILDAQQPVELNADLQAKTQVGGDLSRPLSSYLSGASAVGSGLAGLTGLGKAASIAIELPVYDALGNLIGFSSAPGAAAGAAAGGAGAAGAGAGGAAAGEAGAEAAKAGLGKSAIIPGLQTALGAYETFKGIEAGSEARAALGGFGLGAGLAGLGGAGVSSLSGLAALGAGPVGIAAAAIAALGASLVNTKEMGDVALRNYWRAIDQGRGFGQAPPKELAEGFINFYRTNKNEFPGQGKYGRKGNEEFLYDMTQVINNAVKEGQIPPGTGAVDIYAKVVEPWINSFGFKQNINADTKRVQDFLMTDIIYNFMQGKPFTNAMVKGDTKYPILNVEYAGQLPEGMAKIPKGGPSQLPKDFDFAGLYNELEPDRFNPFIEAEGRETIMPVGESVPIEYTPPAPVPEEPVYIPRQEPAFIQPEPAPSPYSPVQEFVGTPYMPPIEYTPAPAPVYEEPVYEEPVYIPQEAYSAPVYEEPAYLPPKMRDYEAYNPYADYSFDQFMFAEGGAIGDGYNFGFAEGGRPMEYRAGGKFLQGPGDGMSDDIKANIDGRQEARLADGEFVIPADVVSHLGNGSSNAGAKKLHRMMARVRQARTGRKKQAPAVKMDRYLPA